MSSTTSAKRSNSAFMAARMQKCEARTKADGPARLPQPVRPVGAIMPTDANAVNAATRIGAPRKHHEYGRTHCPAVAGPDPRSEEHTSELQSLMRTSYAVFCLKKKTNK